MALTPSDVSRLLILDIETAGISPDYNHLPERFKPHWEKKSTNLYPDQLPSETFEKRAGIYSEFSQVITIGLGVFYFENNELKYRVQAHSSTNEKELLIEFASILDKQYASLNKDSNERYSTEKILPLLVAHNGKEFDYPFLCRRYLVNGLDVPNCLYSTTRKPWENNLRDTMELWKFGDWKNYTSLDMLATLFDIPSSKTGFDGSQVHGAFHNDKDLKKISEYCAADVVVTGQLFLRMNNHALAEEKNISIVIK